MAAQEASMQRLAAHPTNQTPPWLGPALGVIATVFGTLPDHGVARVSQVTDTGN